MWRKFSLFFFPLFSHLTVIFVSIVCVIKTAFSSSFSIKLLFPVLVGSSLVRNRWCSCITLLVVTISWLMRLVHSWVVTETSKNHQNLRNFFKFLHSLSAVSMSLSLHGISAMPAASSIFFELSRVLILVIRRCSTGMFRGRGGTAGFVGLVTTFGGGDSSELDSSWPAVVRFTLLYEFCIPFRRLMIPAALRGLIYFCFSSPPLILFTEEIVGRRTPPREVAGSERSESL